MYGLARVVPMLEDLNPKPGQFRVKGLGSRARYVFVGAYSARVGAGRGRIWAIIHQVLRVSLTIKS